MNEVGLDRSSGPMPWLHQTQIVPAAGNYSDHAMESSVASSLADNGSKRRKASG